MFQTKKLELSSEDYENLIQNGYEEDQLFNSELNKDQILYFYQEITQKSRQNKLIKKQILIHEEIVNECMEDDCNFQKKYNQNVGIFRLRVRELFDQLNFMHLPNLSSAIELLINRLIEIQQRLMKKLLSRNQSVHELEEILQNNKILKKNNICKLCGDINEKSTVTAMYGQIMGIEQSDRDVNNYVPKRQNVSDLLKKDSKKFKKYEEMEFQLQSYNYQTTIDNALKNKDKLLKINRTQLPDTINEFLNTTVNNLENYKKITSTLNDMTKSIKETVKLNPQFPNIKEMKKLINISEYNIKVEGYMEQPFLNFKENIDRYLKEVNKVRNKINGESQTVFISEFQMLKMRDTEIQNLNHQINSIRETKFQSQNQHLKILQKQHVIEKKALDLGNKCRQQQNQIKRLQRELKEMINKLAKNKEDNELNEKKILDKNVEEKNKLILQNKKLERQFKVIKKQTIEKIKLSKEIQTQFVEISKATEKIFKKSKMMTNMSNQNRSSQRNSMMKGFQKNQINVGRPKLQKKSSEIMSPLPIRKDSTRRQSGLKNANGSKTQDVDDIVKTIQEQNQSKKSLYKTNSIQKRSRQSSAFKISHKQLVKGKLQKISNSQLFIKENMDLQSVDDKVSLLLIGNKNHNNHSQSLSNSSLKNLNNQRRTDKKWTEMQKKVIYRRSQFTDNFSQAIKISKFFQNHSSPNSNSKLQFQKENSNKIYNPHLVDQQQLQRNSKRFEQQQAEDQQIQSLVIHCKKNYKLLKKHQIFKMIQQLDIEEDSNGITEQEIHKSQQTTEKQQINHYEPIQTKIDLKIGSRIMNKDIQVFFSIEEAKKYQLSGGVWKEIDSYLAVDNKYMSLAEKIQNHFQRLKSNNVLQYQEYMIFLTKPHYFWKEVLSKDIKVQKIAVFKESLEGIKFPQKNWIRDTFRKIIRLHKMVHKRCKHVQQFLKKIQFKEHQFY